MVKKIKINLPVTFEEDVSVKIGSSYHDQAYITGESNFAGNGGVVTIAHDLGQVPSAAYITPLSNPGGYIGEHWVVLNLTNIQVGNTGSYTGAFKYVILK